MDKNKHMKETKEETHESYGMVDISRFTGNGSEFFGSDLVHNGGISITIRQASKKWDLGKEWYRGNADLISVELSHNQFVDAITSGMNTSGVPCTITKHNNKRVPQISHAAGKKDKFINDMKETHAEYKNKIDNILSMLDGNIGKRKATEIEHSLKVLKSHIESNTNFVMTCFNESMEKTVTEAKHSIANYIDHKVHSLGIEGLQKELKISIEKE